MSKRTVIVGLLGLNLFLLGVLIFSTYDPPAAMAQSRGRAGDFAITTMQIHKDYDAVALINLPAAKMYFFVPQARAKTARLVPTDMRDLNRDFQRR